MRRGILDRITDKMDPPKALLPPRDDEAPIHVAQALSLPAASAAAWLVWQKRKSLHRTGSFIVTVAKSCSASKDFRDRYEWFYIALARLRRSEMWSVETVEGKRDITFTITWTTWGAYGAAGAR